MADQENEQRRRIDAAQKAQNDGVTLRNNKNNPKKQQVSYSI